MAEELDSAQKPKVELIKRPKGEGESSGGGKNIDGGNGKNTAERPRKVIVVKKKAPAASAAGSVKKPQPRVVITKSDAAGLPQGAANRDSVSRETAKTAVEGQDAAVKTDSAPAVDAGIRQTKPAEEGGAPQRSGERKAVSLPNTQRPALAAGKVRGRLVGSRPAREDGGKGAAIFTQRPAAAAGRVGGRPVGNRTGNEGGFPGRFGDRTSGGPGRPGGFGGQRGGARPGAPGTGGRPGGFSGGPRTGVLPRQGGPRPGAGNLPPPGSPLGEGGKGPAKKTFKAKKTVYQHREHEMEEKLLQTKKKITATTNPVPKSIDIMEVVSVSELAKKMNLKASDLIHKLMSMGMMVTINQQIDADTATLLAAEFGADVKIVSLYEETVIESEADDAASLAPRPPVVTVMGHVDHGKTKLLDAIRSADVVAGEFGGITQHIGAYMVETPHGSITFLDTPGHEAFTRMRARGAQVTDIVVLVVAADDGVMPQTVEAINHAKEADVPIIVAVNKMDKPEANPDRVKTQLSEHQLIPEEWGGQTMFVQLSALKKEGIDKLIEAILLEAEILDLKANYDHNAEGKILEARIDHGRGIVATVLVERGTLRIGDSFVAGIWPGKVRALFNDKGEKVSLATPSMPVEVLGFEGGPNAGEPLQVVEDEKVARGISAKRQELKRFEDAKNIRKITLDNLRDTIKEGSIQELKVIIKADVQGSAEALRSSLEKLSTAEVRLHVIQALPGAINEGDVDLAIASNAIIIGFNVRPVPKAKLLADQEKVDIRKYNIIYKAVEEIQQAMEGMLKPDTREDVIATVEVRNTFKVPKAGTIAGCYVLTGTVKRNASVNVIREEIVIYTGRIASLRRFKDDAREVAAGYECGMGIEGFDDIRVGDQLEVFEIVEVARKLN
ncbi:MAG: translation initiation factor IF-2 [Spirochaetaceae bacterium]|jgi:translation initiation factor IF-2|nr:translation initiation factor IF-2 [Spirochaetaceae bacterium]